MCKELILLCCLALSTQLLANEQPIPFPAEIQGGKKGLEDWANSRQATLPSVIQSLSLGSRGDVVVLYHSSGSGRPLVDTYVYGCNASNCSLLALKRGILIDPSAKEPLTSQLLKNKSEFLLTSSNGVAQLRLSLGGP
jgi:hypothetical protein